MSEFGERLDGAQQRLRESSAAAVRYLTVPDVMELAHCAHTTVRSAVHDGSLRAFRHAGRILVREEDAIAWIEHQPAHRPRSQPRPRPARRRGGPGGSVAAIQEMERKGRGTP